MRIWVPIITLRHAAMIPSRMSRAGVWTSCFHIFTSCHLQHFWSLKDERLFVFLILLTTWARWKLTFRFSFIFLKNKLTCMNFPVKSPHTTTIYYHSVYLLDYSGYSAEIFTIDGNIFDWFSRIEHFCSNISIFICWTFNWHKFSVSIGFATVMF